MAQVMFDPSKFTMPPEATLAQKLNHCIKDLEAHRNVAHPGKWYMAPNPDGVRRVAVLRGGPVLATCMEVVPPFGKPYLDLMIHDGAPTEVAARAMYDAISAGKTVGDVNSIVKSFLRDGYDVVLEIKMATAGVATPTAAAPATTTATSTTTDDDMEGYM